MEKGLRVSLEIEGLVTSIIPDQAGWLITTQGGGVFQVRGKDVTKVFDVSGIEAFSSGGEEGLLSIATRGRSYYLAYTLKEGEGTAPTTVIVNEYTREFKLLRNIASIRFPTSWHHGGTLGFDEKGSLYLSTGDGEGRDPQNLAQNRRALQGKILRFDISQDKPSPEIVAYGLRNPWKFSIDQRGRMFIGDVGGIWREEVNLISDLYSSSVPNFGSRVFFGSTES
jgi:glucose/arabinose dehydrogenase